MRAEPPAAPESVEPDVPRPRQTVPGLSLGAGAGQSDVAQPGGPEAADGASAADAPTADAPRAAPGSQAAPAADAPVAGASAREAAADDGEQPAAGAPGSAPALRTGSRRRRRAAGAAGAAGVLALGLTAGALADDGVPGGVRVAGVDVGGMSRTQAEAAVRAALQPRLTAPVQLAAAGEVTMVQPAAAGLALDLDAVLDAALDDATSAGLLDRLRGWVGTGREVQPVPRVDEARLRGAVSRFARTVDRRPREGAVRYDEGVPVAVQPRAGRTLRVDDAVRTVRSGWPEAQRIELPVDRPAPRTSAAQVQEVLTGPAARAVQGPVTLDGGERDLVVRPEDLAPALSFVPDAEGHLAPRLDDDRLFTALRDELRDVEVRPRDARFRVRDDRPVVVPARDGRRVDRRALPGVLLPTALGSGPRTAPLPTSVQRPELTTERAEGLGVREEIGSFTTRHPCCRPRVTNIHRMADLLDGTVVLPGETFSLNGAVGPRDRARGFVAAPQILEGQFVDRVGGGVSQFGTTMYNAVFFAGLEDVEHRPHSYYITRYPEGREATVSTPAPDLKWRNDSEHGVLVTTSYTDTSITVTLWGTQRYDEVRSVTSGRTNVKPFGTEYVSRDDCTASAGHVGFDITITRVMEEDGREVRRDSSSHRYLPEPRFICGDPPPGTPRKLPPGETPPD